MKSGVFFLVLLLFLLPTQAIASDMIEKTFCAQATEYENVEILKVDLLLNSKWLVVYDSGTWNYFR